MKSALTAGLCLLAAWAGATLARRAGSATAPNSDSTSNSQTAHPVRTPAPAATPATASSTDSADSRQLAYRRTLTRCETADLWKWLQEQENSHAPFFDPVLAELLDRLGPAAIDTAFALPDPDQQRRLSDWLLSRLATRDPGSAFQIYQDHRSRFDPRWGAKVASAATFAAFTVSADRAIEVMSATSRLPEPVTSLSLQYPPGFDFRKVMDYLAEANPLPVAIPFNLRTAWADAAPDEAVAWFAAHAAMSSSYGKTGDYAPEATITAVANSNQSGRAAAFRSLATLPAADLDKGWQSIGRNSQGFIEPPLLEAATAIGYRDAYLASSLLCTRESESLPDSWAEIPPADRAPLLDLALQQWTAANPTSVATKARAHWRAAIEKQWAGMNP